MGDSGTGLQDVKDVVLSHTVATVDPQDLVMIIRNIIQEGDYNCTNLKFRELSQV